MKHEFFLVQSRNCCLDTVRGKFDLKSYPINHINNRSSNNYSRYSFTWDHIGVYGKEDEKIEKCQDLKRKIGRL